MTLDGENRIEIIDTDGWGDIKVTDGWIYYWECKKGKDDKNEFPLYRIRTDGTNNQLITDENIGDWTVFNGWIYHSSFYDVGIFKIKADGTSSNIKISNVDAGDLKILDEWIYFRGLYSRGYKYKKI